MKISSLNPQKQNRDSIIKSQVNLKLLGGKKKRMIKNLEQAHCLVALKPGKLKFALYFLHFLAFIYIYIYIYVFILKLVSHRQNILRSCVFTQSNNY